MIGRIFGVICILSAFCAIVRGEGEAFSSAVLEGAEGTVTLMLTLGGSMCLWSGLLEVLKQAGAIRVLTRLLMPLYRRIFAKSAVRGTSLDALSASFAANLLGIGNAATPLGIKAMEELEGGASSSTDGKRAAVTDDQALFVVLNTTPPALLPTTLITLRYAGGSLAPFAPLPFIWAVSVLGSVFAIAVTRSLARIPRNRGPFHIRNKTQGRSA